MICGLYANIYDLGMWFNFILQLYKKLANGVVSYYTNDFNSHRYIVMLELYAVGSILAWNRGIFTFFPNPTNFCPTQEVSLPYYTWVIILPFSMDPFPLHQIHETKHGKQDKLFYESHPEILASFSWNRDVKEKIEKQEFEKHYSQIHFSNT